MPDRPIRVALLSELPTPYRWPIFRRLLDRPELDLRVFFCARSEPDRSWRFPFLPDSRVSFLPAHTLSWEGRRTIHYHVNPTVFGALRRGRFDVVVFPGYAMFASHFGELWCRLRGTPYIVFSETNLLGRRRRSVRAAKEILVGGLVSGASAWLATGKLSREYLVRYGAREDAVFPFPNTPDVGAFAERAAAARCSRDEVRSRHGAGAEPVVLFVGRLIGVKRADLLLRAAGRLSGEPAAPRVWIAGDGPERGRLEALAAREAPGRVRFLGNVDTSELPSLYAASDLFVLPSEHEPWGAVVCEAAACGLPLVVSDRVGAGPELVDAETGGVFASGDAAGLADLVKDLLSDPDRLRRMGERSAFRAASMGPDLCVESFLRAVSLASTKGVA